jgi:hypothetical protein
MTRATITVEIPEEMKGQTFFPDKSGYKYVIPQTSIPFDDSNYVTIYCHLDGSVGSLGKDLSNNYNTFKDVMEKIICDGDCSYLGMSYRGWRDEAWENNMPKFTDKLPDIQEDWQYLFTKECKWYARSKYNKEYNDFVLISKDYGYGKETVSLPKEMFDNIINHVENVEEKLKSLKEYIKSINNEKD